MILRYFRKLLLLTTYLVFAGLLSTVLQRTLWENFEVNHHGTTKMQSQMSNSNTKLLLWWTQREFNHQIICGSNTCNLTSDRTLYRQADAIMFYGTQIDYYDMPLPRQPHHWWALLHEESPQNLPYIKYNRVLQHFNVTSTFSRYSDFPLTLSYLPSEEILIGMKYVVPLAEKNKLRDVLAPIIFLQNDCNVMTGRDKYTQELMKYIEIDRYGRCLGNRELSLEMQNEYLNTLYAPKVLRFFAKYKFILSMENGVCYDYITEKFWRPLAIGTIPIYFGAPNVRDWEPNFNSAIYIRDFESPKKLAEYLWYVDRNDNEYNKYLKHKNDHKNPISNKRLKYGLSGLHFPNLNFWTSFKCAVCGALNERSPKQQPRRAKQSHYNCPLSLMLPKMTNTKLSPYWIKTWRKAEVKSKILDKLWQQNKNYTSAQYDEMLSNVIKKLPPYMTTDTVVTQSTHANQ